MLTCYDTAFDIHSYSWLTVMENAIFVPSLVIGPECVPTNVLMSWCPSGLMLTHSHEYLVDVAPA